MTYTRNQLTIGDVLFIQGYRSSRVEVIGNVDDAEVKIKYLSAPAYKPELKGTTRLISRKILYPRGGR